MPAHKNNPFTALTGIWSCFSGHKDEQSSASKQNYASDRSAIGAARPGGAYNQVFNLVPPPI